MYEDRYEIGNRDAWDFEFPGNSLIKSAEKRLAYHKGRESYWLLAAEKTEAEIRAKGVKLEERAVTGGNQFVAMVDQAMGQRCTSERSKAEKHRSIREQLEGFVHEFTRTPARVFKLKLADMRFFGLIGETTRFGNEEI